MIKDRYDLHLPFLVFNKLLYLDKNGLFGAEISVHKSAFFFFKDTLFKLPENAP